MNPEAEQYLKSILAKQPHELVPEEIGFLKARIAYVGKNSREKFAEILNAPIPQAEVPVVPETTEEVTGKPTKGKKNKASVGEPTFKVQTETVTDIDDDGPDEDGTTINDTDQDE